MKRLIVAGNRSASPTHLPFRIGSLSNFRGRLIDIAYAKGMKRAAPLFAKWNALSRVEVDEQGGPKVILIDADASTYLMNADPHHSLLC